MRTEKILKKIGFKTKIGFKMNDGMFGTCFYYDLKDGGKIELLITEGRVIFAQAKRILKVGSSELTISTGHVIVPITVDDGSCLLKAFFELKPRARKLDIEVKDEDSKMEFAVVFLYNLVNSLYFENRRLTLSSMHKDQLTVYNLLYLLGFRSTKLSSWYKLEAEDGCSLLAIKSKDKELSMSAFRVIGSERYCSPVLSCELSDPRCVQRLLSILQEHAHEVDMKVGRRDAKLESLVIDLYENACRFSGMKDRSEDAVDHLHIVCRKDEDFSEERQDFGEAYSSSESDKTEEFKSVENGKDSHPVPEQVLNHIPTYEELEKELRSSRRSERLSWCITIFMEILWSIVALLVYVQMRRS